MKDILSSYLNHRTSIREFGGCGESKILGCALFGRCPPGSKCVGRILSEIRINEIAMVATHPNPILYIASLLSSHVVPESRATLASGMYVRSNSVVD